MLACTPHPALATVRIGNVAVTLATCARTPVDGTDDTWSLQR